MKRVLFLCTHNSVRSQMAEGWIKSLFPGKYEAYSAGTKPTQVNPMAIQVMKEAGVNISRQTAKSLKQFIDEPFDIVVTLCDSAKENCPIFPGAKKTLHRDFSDPSSVKEDDRLALFRQVRDQIKVYIQETFGTDNRA